MPSAFAALSALDCANIALFVDFDGTLTPIVGRPDQVRVDERIKEALSELTVLLGGAMAVVSGRPIADLDRYLSPHHFKASGVHGLELRNEGHTIHRLEISEAPLGEVVKRLKAVAEHHDGLLLEQKPGSVALHYRASPHLFEHCRQVVADAVEGREELVVVEGKMVIEVKGHRGSKRTAIEALMAAPPFRSRTPVFLGDDVTDEAGFMAVNAFGGISIKVGNGETVAQYRLNDTAQVMDWLENLVAECDVGIEAGEAAT